MSAGTLFAAFILSPTQTKWPCPAALSQRETDSIVLAFICNWQSR